MRDTKQQLQRRELNSVVAEATLGARLTRGQAPPEAPLPSALWKLPPRGLVTSDPSLFIHARISLPGFLSHLSIVNRKKSGRSRENDLGTRNTYALMHEREDTFRKIWKKGRFSREIFALFTGETSRNRFVGFSLKAVFW